MGEVISLQTRLPVSNTPEAEELCSSKLEGIKLVIQELLEENLEELEEIIIVTTNRDGTFSVSASPGMTNAQVFYTLQLASNTTF